MRFHLFLIFLSSPLVAFAVEKTALDELLEKLGSDEFSIRNQAEREIAKYQSEHPTQVWSIGKKLVAARKSAGAEVTSRLDRILQTMSVVKESTSGFYRAVTPSNVEVVPEVGDPPLLVILMTSDELLRFYRPIAQSGTIQKIPPIDFRRTFLLGVFTTRQRNPDKAPRIVKHSFRRHFEDHTAKCHVAIEWGDPGSTTGSTSPGVIGVDYEPKTIDFPIVVTYAIGGAETKVFMELKKTDAGWEDSEVLLQRRNILGLRSLAKVFSRSVPDRTRRGFLEKGCRIDPLLPYILLTSMARKSPDLFLQDYAYWQDKAPDSAVVGALFRGALKHGKEIVDRTESRKP